MSLSKELCLRSDSQNSDSFSDCLVNKFESKEDNYRRDSFCDRFCDDLCEDILQYLSLEDKLRKECVSKQFQRTVFKRQYELFVSMRGPDVHKIYLDNKDSIVPKRYNYFSVYNPFRRVHNYYYIEDQNLQSFEALLKKCPNIASIELDGPRSYERRYDPRLKDLSDVTAMINNFKESRADINYNPGKVNEVFQLIIKNCNNLSEFIAMFDISYRNREAFRQRFGSKIKHLRTVCPLIDVMLFDKIEKIQLGHSDALSAIFDFKQFLPKLKQLEVEFDQGQEDMIQTFIDTFPTLTHFNVFIDSDDENAIYESLKNISNLKHLIHLLLNIDFGKNNNRFCGLLEDMANNCRNLKSFICRLTINRKNSNIKQFLSQMTTFPALKRLNLELLFVDNEGNDNIDVNQLFSFELFKGFENITHLSLTFDWSQTLKDSILKEIDINLPKLQYLEIKHRFDTTPEGVTQMADILSRLSRLQRIQLEFKSGIDFKPIEEQITKKCRKIEEIKLSNI